MPRRRPPPGGTSASSVDPLDVDLDLAAAGEPYVPSLLVSDAEIEEARLAIGDRGKRLLDDRALDAAARDGADEVAGIVDRELRADRAGRGAPGGDDGRKRHALAGALPRLGLLQDLGAVIHVSAPVANHQGTKT